MTFIIARLKNLFFLNKLVQTMMSSFIPDLFIPIVSITALLLAVVFFMAVL